MIVFFALVGVISLVIATFAMVIFAHFIWRDGYESGKCAARREMYE